jgi:hypothetical protein
METSDKDAAFQQALTAYRAILRKSGCSQAGIYKREHMIRCLLPKLQGRPVDGTSYREIVDALLETMNSAEDHRLCLTATREFYPFLTNNVKAIAQIAASGGFSGQPITVPPVDAKTIDDLLRRVEAGALSAEEEAIHARYLGALRAKGLELHVLQTRGRLAKVLLATMSGLPVSETSFRAVIDQLLPLFTVRDTRLYFLAVAREFYYFLLKVPDADSKVASVFRVDS